LLETEAYVRDSQKLNAADLMNLQVYILHILQTVCLSFYVCLRFICFCLLLFLLLVCV